MAAPVKSEVQKPAPPIEVPPLSLDELKEKTDNFGSKALIGEGSYGRVYYANLSNGKAVAVKKLDVSSEPESNPEFLSQVCSNTNNYRIIILSLLVKQFSLIYDFAFSFWADLTALIFFILGFHGF